ncbi:ABC transporter permease [Mycobacterium manitobense]|uniref:ABC transporter permease n=1 Tax=[Mycobacterium] manitobense TaxID=190147 RepID=A0A9X3BV98_9MYCO|nr:ABC transporter permease [[Mycobacterium] manitobense]MCV7170251.1 ABC transporter permease [[Mycobacterium] manitobense]
MSGLAALSAERIKLFTTRSPVWSVAGAALLSLALAAVQGRTAYEYSPVSPQEAALGVTVFGVPVLMILASTAMTAEYRHGLIHTTLLATPQRTRVLAAKTAVAAVFSAISAAVMALAAIVVARLAADPLAGGPLSPASREVWEVIGGVALYAALAAVLGVAVGALLRVAAGAVAVLLLWPLVAEPILANVPDLGTRVGPWLPFGNVFRFLDVTWLYPTFDMAWGPAGSLVYFAATVAVVWVAAAVVLVRRDA